MVFDKYLKAIQKVGLKQTIKQNIIKDMANILDRSAQKISEYPTSIEDLARFPECDWELRTIIIIFPPSSPFHFLNLNLTQGLTGFPVWDLPSLYGESDPKKGMDIQFALQYKDGETVSYKNYVFPDRKTEQPNNPLFHYPGRVELSGKWPDYTLKYHQEEAELTVDLKLTTLPYLTWWASSYGHLYHHYTSYAEYKGTITHGEIEESIKGSLLFDHAWGNHFLNGWFKQPFPLSLFWYEVLSLKAGEYSIALQLNGTKGIPIRQDGNLRLKANHQNIRLPQQQITIDQWKPCQNILDQRIDYPAAWQTELSDGDNYLSYKAEALNTPAPVMGEGVILGFKYRGKRGSSSQSSKSIQGYGYLEYVQRK